MANPFLVLGGIAVGVVTAAFGILQVPGWVSSAQDASAKNDISQVSILQSASLSQTGEAQNLAGVTNPPATLGVDVSTKASGEKLDVQVTTDKKHYSVVVESDSGKAFSRVDGGEIKEHADITTAKNAASQALAAIDPA